MQQPALQAGAVGSGAWVQHSALVGWEAQAVLGASRLHVWCHFALVLWVVYRDWAVVSLPML